MLAPSKHDVPSKCQLTIGFLPKFNDPKQPPSKGKPFSTILAHPLLHTIDLVLPESFYKASQSGILTSLHAPKWALVTLRLSEILSGNFFTTYIKIGDIALQSAGRAGLDPVITLSKGQLRLELPRDLYERVGLAGHPVRHGGRKHIKERFAVEIDLRAPAMMPGRKGFDRLVRAAENVLNEPTKFLFADLQGDLEAKDAPVRAFAPDFRAAEPSVRKSRVRVPPMDLHVEKDMDKEVLEEEAMDLQEWLDLVVMDSPRVGANDDIDPFLSRYAVPGEDKAKEADVVCLSWHGYIPSTWARDMLALWLNAARKEHSRWLAMSGHMFRTAAVDSDLGWTLLRPPEVPVLNDDDLEIVMADAESGAEGQSSESDERSKVPKPFPRFILWEMTAGEHG